MFINGNICGKHPELEGKRWRSNKDCPACVTARRDAWRLANSARELAANRQYKRDNPDVVNALCNKRNAQRRKATPKWANLEIVAAFYTAAAAVRDAGHPCEVDHIVPLQHPLVCGLHNEFNLQIMSKVANMRKGNRWWPDMPQST